MGVCEYSIASSADETLDEALLRTKDIAHLQRPSERDYQSVRDWFVDEKPLVDDEELYIQRKEDIITLRSGRECGSFDSFVERVLSRVDLFMMNHCKCNIIKVRPICVFGGRHRTATDKSLASVYDP